MTWFLFRILNPIGWWVIAIWLAAYATLRPHSGQSMNSPITVGNLTAFVVVFGVIVGLGISTARIASRKGYDYTWWSYYGLFLGYIALPHILLKRSKPKPAPNDPYSPNDHPC